MSDRLWQQLLHAFTEDKNYSRHMQQRTDRHTNVHIRLSLSLSQHIRNHTRCSHT